MRIAVIGGTFNPPTNAHIKLAKIAYEMLQADFVLLVPAKQDYMRQWKSYQNSDILSDSLRMKMLHAIEEEWLKIDTCEMDGLVSGSTYDTLEFLRSKYQTNDIFFVIGSDKLEEIPRWFRSEELLKLNQFLVLKRGDDNIKKIIHETEALSANESAFIACEVDDAYNSVSSTEIRNMLAAGSEAEKIRELVPDKVYQLLISSNITKYHVSDT